MSPWNAVTIATAGIAALSLVVAISGLVLGIVNSVRTYRLQFPRPRWLPMWDNRMHEPWMVKAVTDSVRFTLTNRGRGTAFDVIIEMNGEPIRDPETRLDLSFAEVFAIWLSLDGRAPVVLADVGNGGVHEVKPGAYYVSSRPRIKVTWSEEPHLHRRKSRTFSFSGSLSKVHPPRSTDPGREPL